jgi:hypothetical protein
MTPRCKWTRRSQGSTPAARQALYCCDRRGWRRREARSAPAGRSLWSTQRVSSKGRALHRREQFAEWVQRPPEGWRCRLRLMLDWSNWFPAHRLVVCSLLSFSHSWNSASSLSGSSSGMSSRCFSSLSASTRRPLNTRVATDHVMHFCGWTSGCGSSLTDKQGKQCHRKRG